MKLLDESMFIHPLSEQEPCHADLQQPERSQRLQYHGNRGRRSLTLASREPTRAPSCRPRGTPPPSIHPVNDTEHLQEFYTNGSGPYTAPSGITNGFQQLTAARLNEIGAEAVVQAGVVNQSHIEYLFKPLFYPSAPTPY
jgi:hypothetical protein